MKPYKIARIIYGSYDVSTRADNSKLGTVGEHVFGCWWYWPVDERLSSKSYHTRREAADALWEASP